LEMMVYECPGGPGEGVRGGKGPAEPEDGDGNQSSVRGRLLELMPVNKPPLGVVAPPLLLGVTADVAVALDARW